MIEALRPYLELLYFLTGGPLLVIVAFVALRQITVTKEAARTASLRESYRIASEQVRVYADHVVPCLNELDKQIAERKADVLFDAEIDIESDGIRIRRPPAQDKATLDVIVAIAPALALAANRLETFSIFFTSGVASEAIAYSSVGTTFVRSVRKLLPILVVSANHKNHENILKLFLIWYHRLEREKLQEQRKEIQSRLAEIKDKKIVPVGTGKDT